MHATWLVRIVAQEVPIFDIGHPYPVSAPSPEVEFRSVLEEMHAGRVWMTLDREAQIGWLRWIEGSGEEPRVRMYQTANKLLEGKRRPPRFVRLRAFLHPWLDAAWW